MKSGYDRDGRTTEEILRSTLVRIEDIAEDERRQGSDLPMLLKIIDALVILDEAPPGFDARICLIVKQPGRTFYWRGVFTANRKVRAGFVDGVPDGIDAALLVDDAAANSFLSGQPMPDNAMLIKYGNQDLLQTFTARYFHSAPSADSTG